MQKSQKDIRILHIDDDNNHLLITKHVFKKIKPSFHIQSVTSPEKALQLLQDQTYDCIVSDLYFPGIDGIEFAKMVKKKHDIPFIIYTGRMSDDVVKDAFHAGVDDYIQKSPDQSHYLVLANRIKIFVERHQTEKILQKSDEKIFTHVNSDNKLLDSVQISDAHKMFMLLHHDFRGFFQTIITSAELLASDIENSEKMLNILKETVDKALGLLEDLCIQTQELRPNIVDIDLSSFIEDIIENSKIPEPVVVDYHFEEGIGLVPLDPIIIHRMLSNLIKNAVEVMPKGGKISITVKKEVDSIHIEVKDTGGGISKENLENIFKPFYSTKPKGYELGLAYCKRAVEVHGGKITVKSEVCKGTSFNISIPI